MGEFRAYMDPAIYRGMQAVPEEASRPPQASRQPSFHGDGGTLFGIYILNLFLTILTLGIYLFWGRVKARRYLFGQAEFEGDRFAYHATGRELLIGWLKVFLVFAVLYGAQMITATVWPGPVAVAVQMAGSLAFLFLIPIAIVGARRFRLSRTSWRGIRFSFRGRARDFLKIYIVGSFLTVVTLGLYYPFFKNNTQRFLISHAYFGSTRFDYDGHGWDLFKPYLLTLALSALALALPFFFFPLVFSHALFGPGALFPMLIGVVLVQLPTILIFCATWLWFIALRDRYVWDHTSFATSRFRSTVTAGRLLGLFAGDALRLVPTLGLALPWVLIRHVRFRFANLFLEGPLDLGAVQQEAQAASAAGAELADFVGFLDFDLGL